MQIGSVSPPIFDPQERPRVKHRCFFVYFFVMTVTHRKVSINVALCRSIIVSPGAVIASHTLYYICIEYTIPRIRVVSSPSHVSTTSRPHCTSSGGIVATSLSSSLLFTPLTEDQQRSAGA